MKEWIKKYLGKIILCAVALAAFFASGMWLEHSKDLNYASQIVNSIKPVRENNLNYRYVYPLLGYDFGEGQQFLRDNGLNGKLDQYVQGQLQAQNAQNISIYVKDFSDNHWAGVNEDEQYHPGSILKVLIMMGYFREAELDPAVLQKNLTYTKSIDDQTKNLDFGSPTDLKIGQSYATLSLIENMIENSDNGAETLLLDNVNHAILNNAYSDLNIPNPDVVSDYTISAQQYVGFLRILYSSTYLTEAFSEEALFIMSKSTYRDGIVAGLPYGIPVAQKYGERVDSSGENIQAVELHNCGIVYAQNHPYSICIMTKGSDVQKLTSVIKGASALVYQNIND